jgi:hypothetical protein
MALPQLHVVLFRLGTIGLEEPIQCEDEIPDHTRTRVSAGFECPAEILLVRWD